MNEHYIAYLTKIAWQAVDTSAEKRADYGRRIIARAVRVNRDSRINELESRVADETSRADNAERFEADYDTAGNEVAKLETELARVTSVALENAEKRDARISELKERAEDAERKLAEVTSFTAHRSTSLQRRAEEAERDVEVWRSRTNRLRIEKESKAAHVAFLERDRDYWYSRAIDAESV